jgi:hypothetical protein
MAYYTHEEYIRDFDSRRIIGIVRTLPNGDEEAREFSSRRILGFYKKKQNVTTDFYGRRIAVGNCVVSFIYKEFEKKRRKK